MAISDVTHAASREVGARHSHVKSLTCVAIERWIVRTARRDAPGALDLADADGDDEDADAGEDLSA
ncbi:MAG TPA: hypothetical protein VF516_00495 [Kofleriaceae bacterium]